MADIKGSRKLQNIKKMQDELKKIADKCSPVFEDGILEMGLGQVNKIQLDLLNYIKNKYPDIDPIFNCAIKQESVQSQNGESKVKMSGLSVAGILVNMQFMVVPKDKKGRCGKLPLKELERIEELQKKIKEETEEVY